MATNLIFIPTHDNEGEPFARDLFAAFETRLAALTGGVTMLPAEAAGVWFNDQGTRFDDASKIYLVEFSDLSIWAAILDVVKWACERFRQEAIFVYVVGSGVISPDSTAPGV